MAKLHPDGVTRTQVSDLFSRNKKAREIVAKLLLFDEGGTLPVGPFRRPRRSPMDEQRQRFRPEFWTCFYAACAEVVQGTRPRRGARRFREARRAQVGRPRRGR